MTVKLVVIFGGDSPEHEISLTGAKAVLNHAFTLGWDVLSVGVTRDGRWLVGAGALERLWRDTAPPAAAQGQFSHRRRARLWGIRPDFLWPAFFFIIFWISVGVAGLPRPVG